MPSDTKAPIIIRKKVVQGHGHHGGAWKVAYADFVTAMMALFIVLWLLSTSEKVKKAVGGYFNDPTGKGNLMGSNVAGTGDGVSVSKDDMDQLKDKLEQAMRSMPEFSQIRDQVQITVTADGLRVELLETERGMFFERGIAKPTGSGEQLLIRLAQELGKLPNNIVIEGHTDAKPYAAPVYSNWELSTDRANTARRIMQTSGLRPDQVKQVRGFAEQKLRKPEDPLDPSNRRISVIVLHLNPPPEQAAPAAAKPAPAHAPPAHH